MELTCLPATELIAIVSVHFTTHKGIQCLFFCMSAFLFVGIKLCIQSQIASSLFSLSVLLRLVAVTNNDLLQLKVNEAVVCACYIIIVC